MVILIPYNPTGLDNKGSRYEGSSRETIARFKAVLDKARIPATVRLTRGRDINAACGQLAAERTAADGGRAFGCLAGFLHPA